jgi:hypothetical protein
MARLWELVIWILVLGVGLGLVIGIVIKRIAYKMTGSAPRASRFFWAALISWVLVITALAWLDYF